jgi:hypothetical protein
LSAEIGVIGQLNQNGAAVEKSLNGFNRTHRARKIHNIAYGLRSIRGALVLQ